MAVERRVYAQSEQTCGKEAEDDAADDSPTAGDQAESGDGSSSYRQGDGSPERPWRGRCLTGGTRGAAGAAGSCQLHVRCSACFGIDIPFMYYPEWKPAQQYVPDRLNMRLSD